MWRAPVLDQGRPGVPALPAIHALQVPATGATALDEVALLEALAEQPGQVPRVPALAEGAAEAGRDPCPAAKVAGEPPPPVLHQIAVGGGAAAPGAAAASPQPVRHLANRLEVGLERGSQCGLRQERAEPRGQAEPLLERDDRITLR